MTMTTLYEDTVSFNIEPMIINLSAPTIRISITIMIMGRGMICSMFDGKEEEARRQKL